MIRTIVMTTWVMTSLLTLGACSGTAPVKPDCGGTLRAVNPPVTVVEKRP